MKIIIPGLPIAKKRVKFTVMNGRFGRAYDPQINGEMKRVKQIMLKTWNEAFESENKEIVMDASNLAKAQSFVVAFTFMFPITDRSTLAKRNAKLWGLQPHNIKPDFDNLEKLYSDCATGIIWPDDSMVVSCCSKKVYDENPRTEIDIMVKEEMQLHPKAKGVMMVFSPDRLNDLIEGAYEIGKWKYTKMQDLLASEEDAHKQQILEHITYLLAEFAEHFADDLKKIKKFSGPHSGLINESQRLTA